LGLFHVTVRTIAEVAVAGLVSLALLCARTVGCAQPAQARVKIINAMAVPRVLRRMKADDMSHFGDIAAKRPNIY
jgi:hypothetical protein